MDGALRFVRWLRGQPNCVLIEPGPRHWDLFTRLCAMAGVRGNLVPDAWFAALAIESGCQWVTLDRDFARFQGLDWCEPPSA
jgi:predicted nucleic acid-binding protein